MNVSMNIEDKTAFYREIHRALKPGAWLVLSEIAKGEGGDLDFPTPWARSADTSFLSSPEETQEGLTTAGFDIAHVRNTVEESREYGERSRAMVERGEKPLHRAVMLIHGDIASLAMTNTSRGLSEGRIVPIEVLARKRA